MMNDIAFSAPQSFQVHHLAKDHIAAHLPKAPKCRRKDFYEDVLHKKTYSKSQRLLSLGRKQCTGIGERSHAYGSLGAPAAAGLLHLLDSPANPVEYVPSTYTPGWEVWFGAFAAAVPFVIGSWEFVKRILIQRRCQRCQGSGLVRKRQYRSNMDVRKCPDCGGFFPWQGWGRFLTSTAAPGNGGPLQQPKGQSSVFYKVSADEAEDHQNKYEDEQSKSDV